ncbi:acid-sensing ion channel 1B [Danio rerio]|uniref:Acid-sensing ion channel 1B n=2 Tax=Danio rerio TaxID=7955 RepID=ASI1B_DANRE|nr:acid-sensing ion channel 1B [Danio rerio]Q708S8.1 RecName: Full=Acid-sensing ion channel 1B; Short=ASIC1-B; AltName: Full=Acid-sensing ion channel 1.1-B; AltName: Full=Amiloride-sensitive cation channel 2-A, neuronal-B; AltName: Full=ZASIC1.1 [Danio rerio]AAI62362.1 Amiloride-sensitive cation channel 2 a [Danio rerio]AAI62368.1 Amiloride-sensitive cation channel 2 a [Danio rerio]CAE81918.1 acid-sensing ion channel 1.1 [Danio rerio]|eukprot:NP_999956.1 acid-sensing ion channel 1B [Danio rerio]
MVRITCTISFSTDDEPVGRSRQGSFDDHYKRVVWSKDGEQGKYQEEGDDPDAYDGPEDEEAPDISLATFFGGCSLHGANHVFVEDKKFSIRQGLWALVFLLAISMFLLQVVDRVIYYLQYDYVTLLDERNAKNMTFPAITLCNYNTFRRSQLSYSDLLFMGPLLGYEDNMAPGIPLAPEPDRQGSRFSLAEFFNRTRHRMDDMLLECNFAGKECGAEHWREIFTRYGKCYTFNSGQDGRPLLITTKGGMGNGLEIMLDIQQDEYLPVWGETDETTFEAGIKVQIHTQDEPPFIDQLGFGVAPGFQTFVSCQEQRLTYLPPPWGDCKATPIDSDFFNTYSITACRIDCETRYLVENCNCRMVHMPGDAPYCTPEQYKECADPALDFLVERDNDYCVCETPCNMTRYGKELSFVRIPSKASAKYLAKKYNKTEQYISDNIMVLDIFFEALNYETIEQKKAYELAGLLGDIGGQMGLFIGASILTILELFDYLYEVIKFKLCRCAKKKHQRSNNNERGAVLSLDDVKRHAPCDNLRTPSTYPANMLPHHPGQGNFEDFTC